jgi:hypothetical protein
MSIYSGYLRSEPNAELNGVMKLRGVRALWQAQGTAYYEFAINRHPYLSDEHLLPPRQDFARDVDVHNGYMVGHYGRATLNSWARHIAEEIQNT